MNLLEMYNQLSDEEKEKLINLIIQELRKKEKEVGGLPIQI